LFNQKYKPCASQIAQWIQLDEQRFMALQQASVIALPEWCIAAGFVRNLVWDYLHHKQKPTPLSDIDLIYFDAANICPDRDLQIQLELRSQSGLPWSVKNQARMHTRNKDPGYQSTLDAMSYWVEKETAVGATLLPCGQIDVITPFRLDDLFAQTVTMNRKKPQPAVFRQRIEQKNWLTIWPHLTIVES